MTSLAKQRLAIERKGWRKDHPHGFVAKPVTQNDGSVQMLLWECKVPGKAGTLWENGLYPVKLEFTEVGRAGASRRRRRSTPDPSTQWRC